jgi:hypothetical protein
MTQRTRIAQIRRPGWRAAKKEAGSMRRPKSSGRKTSRLPTEAGQVKRIAKDVSEKDLIIIGGRILGRCCKSGTHCARLLRKLGFQAS